MKKIKTLMLALAFCGPMAQAQYFDNIYPFNADINTARVAHQSIIATEKGSVVINHLNNDHTLLSFIDQNGNRLWSNEYDLGDPVHLKSGVITDDGNVLVIGDNGSTTKSKCYVIKVDIANGNLIWKQEYYFAGHYVTSFNTLARTNENHEYYVIAGSRISLESDAHNQLYVTKIDGGNGAVIWGKEYFDPNYQAPGEIDIPTYIKESPKADISGEILVAGTRSYTGAKANIFTIIIDNTGNIIRGYTEYKFSFFHDSMTPHVAFVADGSYLIVFDAPGSVGAIKLDAAHNVSWNYYYKFPTFNENLSGSVFNLADESYNISGWGFDPVSFQKYPYILNIDKLGNQQWGKYYTKKSSFQHISMMPAGKSDFLLHSVGQGYFSLLSVDENGEKSECYVKELPNRLFTFVNPAPWLYRAWDAVPEYMEENIAITPRESKDTDCGGNPLQKPARANSETGIPHQPQQSLQVRFDRLNNQLWINRNSGEARPLSIEIRNSLGQLLLKKTVESVAHEWKQNVSEIAGYKTVLFITVFVEDEKPQTFKILAD